MYVCLCKGITDSQIKQSIRNGADSVSQVRKATGAATQCCKCLPEVRAIINDQRDATDQSVAGFSPLFFPAYGS